MSPVTPIFGLKPITFRRRALIPPTALYVTGDDRIVARIRTPLQVFNYNLRVRQLMPDGTVKEYERELQGGSDFGPGGDVNIRLLEGFLLSIAVSTPDTQLFEGVVWSRVELRTGGLNEIAPSRMLIRGWLTMEKPLSWPEGPLEPAQLDRGPLFVDRPPDPTAGANLEYIMPSGYRARLIALHLLFTAAAAPMNRTVQLRVEDAVDAFLFIEADYTQTATQQRAYEFLTGFGNTYNTAIRVHVPLPTQLFLQEGYILRIVVGNIQAADQISDVRVFMEHWVIPGL